MIQAKPQTRMLSPISKIGGGFGLVCKVDQGHKEKPEEPKG